MLSEVTSLCGNTCLRSGKSQDMYLGIVGMRRILKVPLREAGGKEMMEGRGGEGKEASGRGYDDGDGWHITLCAIQGVLCLPTPESKKEDLRWGHRCPPSVSIGLGVNSPVGNPLRHPGKMS